MENNSWKVKWEWKKREIRYLVNNSLTGRIWVKLRCELRELFWLGIGLGILVVVVNLFCI